MNDLGKDYQKTILVVPIPTKIPELVGQDYQKTILIQSVPQKAMETAKIIFLQNNFAMHSQGTHELEFECSGKYFSKENPLQNVSHAWLVCRGTNVTLQAKFKAARISQKYALVLSISQILLLLLFLNIILKYSYVLSLFPIMLFLIPAILFPLIPRWDRRRTIQALDNLMSNISQVKSP